MFEDLCYKLLLAITKGLEEADIPLVFWSNFRICVNNHDCLQRTAERWKRDWRINQKFRLAMNSEFTVHIVFSLENNKICVSLDGMDAPKYRGYVELIQSVVDEFLSKT
jgi:hypothetical protein